MYKETGRIPKNVIVDLKKLLDSKEWRWEWPIENWEQIVFMRLPAHTGKLYRHYDEGFGYTIPIETNEDCVSLSYENDAETEHYLEVGKIYLTDRSIEHEAFNSGKTDRTYLLVMLKEYPDNE
jgi:hypothetical protein